MSSRLRERQVFHGSRARILYELIGWQFRNATDLRFMNYGLAPAPGRETMSLRPGEQPERYCAALYHAVAAQADLRGARVLDVGCGRGGGTAYVHRHLGPAETTGCDIARHSVAFCRKVHGGVAGLGFRHGDATALPFAAESFDAVLNVESAHCYRDRAAFFAEAFRVLRPGGHLLLADFTPPRVPPEAERARIERDLSLSGFASAGVADITAGILRGLDLDHDRRMREIRARFPLGTRRLARLWAGTRGSWIYRDFAEGRRAYFLYRIEKPAVAVSGQARPLLRRQPRAGGVLPVSAMACDDAPGASEIAFDRPRPAR
ncbi:class I SAM-dependent methyltransferase [Albidovulum sp.]|uniref:class I SAM-dependent methyltransferase n=1 Tax=Albidovulum sp. TaxID=1872424 RepID=UPI0039B8748A